LNVCWKRPLVLYATLIVFPVIFKSIPVLVGENHVFPLGYLPVLNSTGPPYPSFPTLKVNKLFSFSGIVSKFLIS